MKRFLKFAVLFFVCFAWSSNALAFTDGKDPIQVVFRFVNGDDMFYVPWNGNDTSLKSLCDVLRENSNGAGSIYVDGYSDTKKLSMIRCNRVKSELIIRTGVTESTFATTNNVASSMV